MLYLHYVQSSCGATMTIIQDPKPFRMQFVFWLNVQNELEATIAEEIEALKQARSFVATVRDGIRLVQDLRRGNTTVLEELFPWIAERYSNDNPSIDAVVDQLARLEERLAQQGSQALPAPRNKQLPPPSAPTLDDIEIKKAGKSDENVAFNLRLSAYGLGGMKLVELGRDVVEYGIKKRKLPETAMQQYEKELAARGDVAPAKPAPKEATEAEKPQGLKKIAGADVALAAPVFDDIDFDF